MTWGGAKYHQSATVTCSTDKGLCITMSEDGQTKSVSAFLSADELAALAQMALETRREILAEQAIGAKS